MNAEELNNKWMQEFKARAALWIHDGNPNRPYARLTSGKISNGFFNASKVIEQPSLVAAAVQDLIEIALIGKDFFPDVVIGSAYGGITLAHELARQLINPAFMFTQPDGNEMRIARFHLHLGSRVIVIDDVMTTGGTTEKTIAEVTRRGGNVLNVVLFLVNRSGKTNLDSRSIIALINHPMPMWNEGKNPFTPDGNEIVPQRKLGCSYQNLRIKKGFAWLHAKRQQND